MDILSIIFHTIVFAILGWIGIAAWLLYHAVEELKQWLSTKKLSEKDVK